MEIETETTKNGSTTDLSQPNVSAEGRVYIGFEIKPVSTPTIYLPVVVPNGTGSGDHYVFDMAVDPSQTYYLDPKVATGYIYQIGEGDPNFASVLLPNIGNATPYQLYLWNGSKFVFDTSLAAGLVYDFAAGGVSEFEVLGIDPNLGLDPSNATAFVTGLTFEGAGAFDGTMTPVTASIPEPSTWAMMLVGFAGLGFVAGLSRCVGSLNNAPSGASSVRV